MKQACACDCHALGAFPCMFCVGRHDESEDGEAQPELDEPTEPNRPAWPELDELEEYPF